MSAGPHSILAVQKRVLEATNKILTFERANATHHFNINHDNSRNNRSQSNAHGSIEEKTAN